MKKVAKQCMRGAFLAFLAVLVSTKSFAGMFVGFPYGIPSPGVYVTVSGTSSSWSHYFTPSDARQIDTGLPVYQAYTVTVSGSAAFYDAEMQVGAGGSFYFAHWRYVGIRMY